MKAKEFNKLTKEQQEEEILRCKSFEYFYNNYCKRDGMPEFSQDVWDEYVEMVNKTRHSRPRPFRTHILAPEECSKIEKL